MMKNKKLISAILAAASIAGGVVGAQAQTVEGLDHKVDSYISAVEQAKTDIKDLQKKVGALDTTGIADNKAGIEANKNAIATQGSQISQLQQDMAQDAMDRVNEMNELTTKVNQKADKSDVETNKNDIASNAAAIQKETQKREDAVKGLQDKLTVANGQIENEKTTRENAVNDLQNQVTANKTDIATLQHKIVASGQAFNADMVDKIKANEGNINTIFGQLDQGAYNKADGYVVKHDDTIGGALKNLDKNADKQHWQIDALEKKTGVNTPLINGAFSLSDGVNANTGKINENTSKIDANTGKINALDKTVDKQHWQIDALEKKTGVNTPLTNGATNLSAGVNENTRKIEAVQNQVTTNKKAIDKQGADISKLQKDTDKQHWQIDALEKKTGVNTPLTNGATNLSAGVNQNTKLVEDEAKAREKADKAEEAARKAEDQKLLKNINDEVTTRENAVNALNSRIGQVESDATKGIAKASALAALHPLDYDPDNKFDIAAAGGFYKGENAFALGAFYRPNRNVMLSMGTTLTSGDNAYNVGLTFKIGKSGKHTEAGLTTADLYAMIGAMQDKMDQQQKKIEELEAKQAK